MRRRSSSSCCRADSIRLFKTRSIIGAVCHTI
jgi:hypothetical protein